MYVLIMFHDIVVVVVARIGETAKESNNKLPFHYHSFNSTGCCVWQKWERNCENVIMDVRQCCCQNNVRIAFFTVLRNADFNSAIVEQSESWLLLLYLSLPPPQPAISCKKMLSFIFRSIQKKIGCLRHEKHNNIDCLSLSSNLCISPQ